MARAVGPQQLHNRRGRVVLQAAGGGGQGDGRGRVRAGRRGGDAEARVVRPPDLPVPDLVVRPARHPQGLGRPRLCPRPHLRRRPHLRNRQAQGPPRDAGAHHGRRRGRVEARGALRRHHVVPAADPQGDVPVRGDGRAAAADMLRAGQGVGGGAQGDAGRVEGAVPEDRGRGADRRRKVLERAAEQLPSCLLDHSCRGRTRSNNRAAYTCGPETTLPAADPPVPHRVLAQRVVDVPIFPWPLEFDSAGTVRPSRRARRLRVR